MRVFVTGGTGFLGNNLIRTLLDQGHQVLAPVRVSSDLRPLQDLQAETLPLNLLDPSEVNLALEAVDAIIHSAAQIHIGWRELESSRQANVETTRILANAARRRKIRMIYVSTVDTLAAADPLSVIDETQTEPMKIPSAYILSKREAESLMLQQVAQGLDGVIVNPGFMVGPRDFKPTSGKMMLMLWKQPILFFTPGGGCSVVDVRNVATGIANALGLARSGERYILAGENMSYRDLWRLMAKVMGRRPPVRAMRNPLAAAVGGVGDLLARGLGRELEINSASIRMGQMFHYYSSRKAEQELNYQITSTEAALADAWDWFREQKYV
jgi:dihydroflavonol-4-reductase